ncbi:MAG: 1-deoxy-D-xylulose-5-phosphate synthase [Muribaculaceae bacterium]|nr:1-deoxy-D-xylulose-5-phosphate synthase [Muribaculaceae bacterium]
MASAKEKNKTTTLNWPIDSPEQLRQLPIEQLPEVCARLREILIDELSRNPGHFASSMGAVDITVALHYIYNTPYDRIVWDVGHQAYAHKLLTGRREQFSTNRTYGGLCGFPSPAESEYDTFAAGHASNSISAAHGMSVASRLQGDSPKRHVIAVIGDASISGGLAFEGLNNLAQSRDDVLIILNDNEMSIDHNVGALSRSLSRLNTSPRYNRIRYKTYMFLRKIGLVSDKIVGPLTRFNNSLKALLSRQQNVFEGLNIRYFGPFDGNDVKEVARILRDIKDMEGPKLLHLRTRKGHGYEPAESDPAHWHAPGKFDPQSGERLAASNADKWQDIFGKTLLTLAEHDPRIVGITAAMLSGTSMNILKDKMPERVFDVGISEGHAVTFAGGLAKEGLKPYVAIYSSFLQRAYDHIFHDIALNSLPVTLCIDRAGLVGEDGATHHGALDIAYLRTITGIIISAPSKADQLQRLMVTAENHDGPMAIRYPRGTAQGKAEQPPIEPWPIGKGEVIAEGTDLLFLTVGPISEEVKKAREILETKGIKAGHYDMVFISPLDENLMKKAASQGSEIITVEDGIRAGGFGSAVSEWLTDNGFNAAKVHRLGLPTDSFVPQGTPAQLYKHCSLDADSIAAKALSILGK